MLERVAVFLLKIRVFLNFLFYSKIESSSLSGQVLVTSGMSFQSLIFFCLKLNLIVTASGQ